MRVCTHVLIGPEAYEEGRVTIRIAWSPTR